MSDLIALAAAMSFLSQAEDGIRDLYVTGVQTCALPISAAAPRSRAHGGADLVRHEHEGPRPVLRQRLPRARDRGAAAGCELVRVRLRRSRGQDPLRDRKSVV